MSTDMALLNFLIRILTIKPIFSCYVSMLLNSECHCIEAKTPIDVDVGFSCHCISFFHFEVVFHVMT